MIVTTVLILFIVINPPEPGTDPKNVLLNFSDTSKVKQTEPMNIPVNIPTCTHVEA